MTIASLLQQKPGVSGEIDGGGPSESFLDEIDGGDPSPGLYGALDGGPVATGSLIGVGDWRLVVEALLPETGSALWDFARWDEDVWGELDWYDMTPYVRGMEWRRGADAYLGRPRVGSATITLDNADARWSPWNPDPPAGSVAYFAPGTVVRCGVVSDTDTRAGGWIPQFTIITDSWSESLFGVGADSWIDLAGFETLGWLAGIDDNALPVPVGSGEGAAQRLVRLLDAAEWPFGLVVDAENLDPVTEYPLLSTDMAANRIAECYQVADSSDVWFRSSRKGEAIAENLVNSTVARTSDVWPLIDFGVSTPNPHVAFVPFDDDPDTVLYVTYDADSFSTATDAEHIMNDARWARAGGTQQIVEHAASIARYGRRSQPRTDLLNDNDTDVAALAALEVNARARSTIRVQAVTIASSDRGDDKYLATIAADIGVPCDAYPPGTVKADLGDQPGLGGRIESMTHRITPRSAGHITWQTVFGVATSEVRNLVAGELPAL